MVSMCGEEGQLRISGMASPREILTTLSLLFGTPPIPRPKLHFQTFLPLDYSPIWLGHSTHCPPCTLYVLITTISSVHDT